MKLAIYCCGGLGKEILMLAREINTSQQRWDEMCFVDDNFNKKQYKDLSVYNFEEIKEMYSIDECEFTVASGEPYIRKKLIERIEDAKFKLCTLIHPEIIITRDTVINEGCIICKGSIVTDDVCIEKGTIVNLLCSIAHDVNIGKYCVIQPHCSISGKANVGDGTHIGTSSAIRDEVKVGANCIIGMGSNITKDIPANHIAYGNPARVISKNNGTFVYL